jgi:nitrous oxidase accessory protein NosD
MAAHPAPQRLCAVLGVMVLAAMVVGGVAPAASADSPPTCRVDNQTQGTDFASDSGQALIDAIAAAVPGDQLAVLGTCTGNFRLDKSLTLTGISQKRFPTPTLDGQQAGTTLTVGPDAAATLTNLTITGGTALRGGGIANNGTVTLHSSTVSGNTAALDGGGIDNNGGTVRLLSSTVSGNTAGGSGGGIYNNGGTVSLENSSVSGNIPNDCDNC